MNLVTHHLDMAWNRRFSGPSWTEGVAERRALSCRPRSWWVPGAVKAENQQTQRNYGKGKEVEDSTCLWSQ